MATISFDTLTNRQIGEIEVATHTAIDDLFIGGKPSWTLTCALTWLAIRETKPDVTLDEILNGSYEVVTNYVEADDPKAPGSES